MAVFENMGYSPTIMMIVVSALDAHHHFACFLLNPMPFKHLKHIIKHHLEVSENHGTLETTTVTRGSIL